METLTMNCDKISKILDELKVNSLDCIRGKNKAINKIHQMHLKSLDSELMDIRVYVAKQNVNIPGKQLLKMIDEFIYQKQII